MGEFIMPAVLGLSGQQLSYSGGALCEEAPSASFGEFMSMVMGGEEIPEVPQQEQETSEDIPQADCTAVMTEAFEAVREMAADGEHRTGILLPEEFSSKGKAAFITALCRFLGSVERDGNEAETSEAVKADAEDMRKIWQDVPENEKSLWAELFERIADIEEGADEEGYVFTAALVRLCGVKSAKKGKDVEADANTAVSAAAMLIPRAMVTQICAENSVSGNVGAEDSMLRAVSEADGNAENIQNVDIIKIVHNVMESDVSTEELAGFFRQTAAELNAQSESSGISITAEPQITETLTDGDIRSEMFTVGRQSVMLRANKPFEKLDEESEAFAASNAYDANIGEAANTSVNSAAAGEASAVAQSEEIVTEYGIEEQIVKKIELYRELEELTVGSQKELTIRLAPEELGELEVRIRSTEDGLEIAFAAERSEAARLIGDKAASLAEAVAAGGSKLREMTVTQQIVTRETGDTLSYGQYGGEAGASGGRDFGAGSRRFVFSDPGTESTETDGGQDPQIFYNKEAKLWVSA